MPSKFNKLYTYVYIYIYRNMYEGSVRFAYGPAGVTATHYILLQ